MLSLPSRSICAGPQSVTWVVVVVLGAGILCGLDAVSGQRSGRLDLVPAGLVFLLIAYGLHERLPLARIGALLIAGGIAVGIPLALAVVSLLDASRLDLSIELSAPSPLSLTSGVASTVAIVGLAAWTAWTLTREDVADEFGTSDDPG